ncbi:MAG: ABC-2 family transporter protein [Acetobacteraceae bacterium]|nr:ABC-2 family transporter protein [Acetobacteraceae bacterium]
MRKYVELARRSFLRQRMYRVNFWLEFPATLLRMVLLVCLWRALYGRLPQAGGLTLPQMTTYALVALALRSTYEFELEPLVEERVHSGQIAVDLLRPVPFQLYLLADVAGTNLSHLLFRLLPLGLVTVVGFGALLPPSWAQAGWFLLAAVLGFFILFNFFYLVSLAAFWVVNVFAFYLGSRLIITFFSGAVVPLWFFPPWLEAVARWLPFQFAYQFPVSVYLGRVTGPALVQGLLLQAGWGLALALVGRAVWGLGCRKVVLHGG